MVGIDQYIGGYSVPTDGIEAIPLTKTSYDIENPAQRKTDFSKSIKIPESPGVNKVFEHLFELNVSLQTFNPNKKTDYLLIGNGIPLLKGYCQLIDVTDDDGLVYYIIEAQGAIGDLYKSIANAELTDLDFSEYNHIWNSLNIQSSWNSTIGEGYKYPMINYGAKANQQEWSVEDFKPALFLKEYIDKIFEAAGYSYTSAFFESDRFKKILIPQSSDTVKLTNDTIKDRQYFVSRAGATQAVGMDSYPITQSDAIIFNDDSTSPNYNTSANDYDPTTGIWTVGSAGRYALKIDINCNVTLNVSTSNSNYYTGLLQSSRLGQFGFVDLSVMVVRRRGAGSPVSVDFFTIDATDVMRDEVITANYTSPIIEGVFTTKEFEAEVGDEIIVKFAQLSIHSWSYARIEGAGTGVIVNPGTLSGLLVKQTTIRPGDTMNLNDAIQQDVKQKDLLNAVIKRFNLYMEYDELNDKNIIIEPIDDFMTDTSEDLSPIVDDSKQRLIKPLGALENSSFLFLDQEAKDEYNVAYQSQKEHTYGYERVVIDNDFLTSEKKIDSIFSPCPLWADVSSNDRIISSIAFPRDLGSYSNETGKLKLIQWGGTLSTRQAWRINENGTLSSYITIYPYAGHLDNPFNPTFDLCFGVPKLLFYDFSGGGLTDLKYTNNNCFNLYWSRHIKEISDKNSKVIHLYLNLNYQRFKNLSFRKKYFIDGSYWRLLEVVDFDPINPKTTKCIFIKLKEHDVFVGETDEVFGGEGTFDNGDKKPVYEDDGIRPGDSDSGSVGNSDGVTTYSGDEDDIFVFSSDGATMDGKDSFAVNSPGELIRTGESYINGVNLERKLEVVLDSTLMSSLATNPAMILPEPEFDEYYKINRAYAALMSPTETEFLVTDLSDNIVTNDNDEIVANEVSGETPPSIGFQIMSSGGYVLAHSTADFFETDNNKQILTIEPENLNFQESLSITQAADSTFSSGTFSESCRLLSNNQTIK